MIRANFRASNPSTPPTIRLMKVGEICRLVNGNAFKPEDWGTAGLPIIRIQNLNDPAKPFNHWAGSTDRLVLVKEGDLLFAWSGTPGTSFGAHIWDGPVGVLNQHIFRVDHDPAELDARWLRYALNGALETIIDLAHGGAGLRHVTKGKLEAVTLSVPPLPEQRRIAASLDAQVEAVACARKGIDEQAKSLLALRSAIQGSLFEEEDERVPLARLIADTRNGIYKHESFYGEGTPILKMFNIGRFDNSLHLDRLDYVRLTANELEKARLRPGDILVNRVNSRELVGKCALIGRDQDGWVCESKNLRLTLRSDRAEPEFIAIWLNSPEARQQIDRRQKQIVGQATISRADLDTLSVPCPSHEEQRTRLTLHRDKVKLGCRASQALAAQRAALDALPFALLRATFRGDL